MGEVILSHNNLTLKLILMNTIKERGLKAINLEQFGYLNKPEMVCDLGEIKCPYKQQRVLRMLIREPFGKFEIPEELKWLTKVINMSEQYQKMMKIAHPFCYVTVRRQDNQKEDNDVWHVDGFSTRITHLPEQNYIFTDRYPTEYIEKAFNIPEDFNPLKHNIHTYFQDNIKDTDDIKVMKPNTLYCLDPYIIHRRPILTSRVLRTFVRITYSAIEILDVNNTPNILIPRPEVIRDGVKDFRNKLIKYSKT